MQLESFFCHVCVMVPQDKLVARGQMQASLTCPVSGRQRSARSRGRAELGAGGSGVKFSPGCLPVGTWP